MRRTDLEFARERLNCSERAQGLAISTFSPYHSLRGIDGGIAEVPMILFQIRLGAYCERQVGRRPEEYQEIVENIQ